MKYVVTLKDRTYEVEVEHGEAMILDEYEAKAPVSAAPAAPAPVAAAAPAAAPAAPAAAPAGDGTPVVAPMPASITAINVKVGDTVAEGDVVVVVEAMKMSVDVAAPSAGVVKQVVVSVGQQVDTGATLLLI